MFGKGGIEPMAACEMSWRTYERIIADLVKLEGENDLLEQFSHSHEERQNIKEKLETYISKVQNYLPSIKVLRQSEEFDVSVPFVLINSVVELLDLQSGERMNLKIVHPYQEEISMNTASYLSPVGFSLLLKNTGNRIIANVPQGRIQYKVEAIHIS